MYKFIDTVESQAEQTLPSEALNFNGVYLENEIPGYRTLYVSGREVLSAEITDTEMGTSDGTRYQRKRYPPRTITVGYQLIAESDAEFRAAFNKMNSLLDADQARMIFADEPDKFFVGTKQSGSDVPTGRNAITAELEFYCADPFKYSVKEYEVSPNADNGSTFVVDYKGTHKAFPRFEVTMSNDENGFIGFVDANKHILQFGDIAETDYESYKRNETLATINDFFSAADDTSGTDYMHPHFGVKGTLGSKTWFNTKFLGLSTVGTVVGNSNGGLRTVVLPADSNGDKGCQNFYAYFHVLVWAGVLGQTGEMCINFLTSDNKLICGINWYKTDKVGNMGKYEFIGYNPNQKSTDQMAGKVLKRYSYTTSHLKKQNPFYWNWGNSSIRKEGNKLTFYWNGTYPTFKIPEIANMKCAKVQVSIKQKSGSNKYMTYLGIDKLNFRKLHVTKWRDAPNQFAKGSVFTADCANGEVEVNGMPTPGLGALGNDWESFCLNPGANQIQCVHSSWAKKPDYLMKYREVYL